MRILRISLEKYLTKTPYTNLNKMKSIRKRLDNNVYENMGIKNHNLSLFSLNNTNNFICTFHMCLNSLPYEVIANFSVPQNYLSTKTFFYWDFTVVGRLFDFNELNLKLMRHLYTTKKAHFHEKNF